jgi:hypothetical protein
MEGRFLSYHSRGEEREHLHRVQMGTSEPGQLIPDGLWKLALPGLEVGPGVGGGHRAFAGQHEPSKVEDMRHKTQCESVWDGVDRRVRFIVHCRIATVVDVKIRE